MIRSLVVALLISASAVFATEPPNDLALARAEITPLFAEMQAAANAHDTDRHLSFYAHETSLIFVINNQQITGWEALRDKQRQWWNDGKTDAVYTQVGEAEYSMLCPGYVLATYFLTSRRTLPTGEVRSTGFGITAIWNKRHEGWRIIYAHEATVQK
jgi:ketosteroid isomerase-like protein